MSKSIKIGWLVILILSTSIGFCYINGCKSGEGLSSHQEAYKTSLTDSNAFIQFAGYPLDNTFSEVRSVKVLYDLHSKHLYYINSNSYHLHFDFCEAVLGYSLGLAVFNATNYSNSFKRDYLLATINYFKESDTYAIEFFADNEMDASQLNVLYDKISKSFFEKSNLKIFLNNENITKLFYDQQLKLPTLTVEEVYKNQQYQMIQQGVSAGYLRILEHAKDYKNEDVSNKIVICNGTPLEMPICKAFVSNAFQTPLSHIQVLAHHRKIPAAALKNCIEKYRKYNDKPVRLTVMRDSLVIQLIDESELKQESQKSIMPIKHLAYDTLSHSILSIKEIGKAQKVAIGNKAYNLSRLYSISQRKEKFVIPELAYAIPIYYYFQHIQQASIQEELHTLWMLNSNQGEVLRKQLKKVQHAILDAPINADLLQDINAKLMNKGYTSFRFRSSCNAEDLTNFSGAGLYDSYTGKTNDTNKTFERAIKKVWASTYNYRAYIERRQFNINESTVMMGVLVHRGFPDEMSNGVVITKNIYRDDYPGYIVNVQKGDISVVNPPEDIVCDQMICSSGSLINPTSDDVAVKYVSKSSINNGQPVLSTKQLKQLYAAVEWVVQTYYKETPYIDIEFKFDKNGQLYLKQVRPYQ